MSEQIKYEFVRSSSSEYLQVKILEIQSLPLYCIAVEDDIKAILWQIKLVLWKL